ncbi:MAG: hypothetical protein COB53_09785 [Elusimicrobia bacterium]|nr:MAG: hypothetical protein COB53_09785 [Elusimicrobiota bacterium]
MKNSLFALIAVAVFAAPAASASIEGLRSSVSLAAPKAQFGFKASRYVSLSGWVNLRGSGFVHEGSNSVRIDLTGNARLSGAGASTDTVWIRESVNIYLLKGQTFVNETVHVSEYVSVYDRGRYVGSTNVSGTIRVSGTVSGSSLRLSGSGNLRGSLFVRDPR